MQSDATGPVSPNSRSKAARQAGRGQGRRRQPQMPADADMSSGPSTASQMPFHACNTPSTVRPIYPPDSASRIGAVVYGALSVLTITFFWSGAPGILGAVAAWLGGLTRGRTPERGAPRIFAIIGLCIAILNCIANVVWSVVGAFVPH
jgi:hypothetical protein